MNRFTSSLLKGFLAVRKSGLAALLMTTAASVLLAQSYQGGIRGTVTDQQGAAVPSAKVTLTNEGTSESRSAVTNANGGYDFTQIVPATYSIAAESPSFKKFTQKGIIVGTQEFLTVDVKLEVGSVSETVLVTEEVPLVESANASQGQVLDNQKLVDLPNLGRNPFMMSKLSQNVVNVGPPAYNRMEDQSGSSMISIAGGPVRGNNYLLDGIPITDANNRAIIIPTIEGVQEVKIQANTYDAEMARTGGGMINTLMRSGSNEYHGSLYGHLRRTSWDANNFFSNAAGIPITDQPNTTWGASFGGPIRIPKLYDGRNRTFFYLAIEHYDDASSNSSNFAAPTLLERQGNFSQSFNQDGSPVRPVDPRTGIPFPNGIIPSNLVNTVGANIASTFPLPTTAPAYYGANDITVASSIKARAVQYTGKVDQDLTHWWRASLSYLRYYSLEPGDTWFNSPSTTDGWRLERRVDATQLNNTFTINPTTVLAVRYGFNRFPNYDYNSSQGYNPAALGFDPHYVAQLNSSLWEFPAVTMTSFHGLGDSGDNDYYSEASNNFSVSVDKYLGRHSLKGGFDYRKLKTSGSGVSNSTGGFTFNTNTPGTNSYTGYDMADLLIGAPYNRTVDTATTLTDNVSYYGVYIQDSFRINSRLSVNYGLRWEHETGISEIHNGLIVNFNRTVNNVLASEVSGITPLGAVEYAGQNGYGTTTGNPTTNKWGPRVGVVYRLNDKTVLRGGYGLFWAPQFALGGPIGTLGYAQTTSYTGSTDSLGNFTPTLTNPIPTVLQPVGNSLGTAAGIGQTFSMADPNAASPRVHQFSVDVQRELPFGIGLEVGYVGSRSNHLILGAPTININALNPSDLAAGADALNAPVANPYYGHITTGTLSQATVPNFYLKLPFSAYGNINQFFSDQNHARYDSMVVKGQKRLSKGLTFLSTLTWSKNLDESSAGPGNALNGGAQGYPQNPYNLAAEYSLSNVDTPLRWATAISYELPFGKGKAFANKGGFLDYIIGGWSINAVAVYQTGFPLQVYQNNANGQYGYGAQRPNSTGVSPSSLTSGSVEARLYDYINPLAFSTAAQGTFGDISRSLTLRGPGQKNWDMSMFKTVAIKERFRAQFRCETLNTFNSPLFASPNTNFSSGTFGQINTQSNFARQLQLALRFSF